MKVAIAGCAGRMGQALVKKAIATTGITLVGGSVRPGNAFVGEQVGVYINAPTPGALLTDNPEELFKDADAVIDFTTPDYTRVLGDIAERKGKVLVCGTTALNADGIAALRKNAEKARIICAPNMSIGVNLIVGLVEKIASILPAEECDIEIDEMHHRFKLDAPSGTALNLGAAAARGRSVQLADVRVDSLHAGLEARKQGAIGFSVRRGGDVIGDHTVTFACAGERIELSHKSSNRDIYAAGAMRACIWGTTQPAGFYTMRDVLGV